MSDKILVSEELFRKFENCRTQADIVTTHLENFEFITPKEAIDEYGIYRLAAVIHRMKKNTDVNFESINVATKNRYGHDCNYSKYKLVKPEKVSKLEYICDYCDQTYMHSLLAINSLSKGDDVLVACSCGNDILIKSKK